MKGNAPVVVVVVNDDYDDMYIPRPNDKTDSIGMFRRFKLSCEYT